MKRYLLLAGCLGLCLSTVRAAKDSVKPGKPSDRPRDRPRTTVNEVESLREDFTRTGEYRAAARLLDVLDQPGTLRAKILERLKKEADRATFLEFLRALKLIEPGTTDQLVAGDIELRLIHDERGRLRGNVLETANEALRYDFGFQYSEEEIGQAFAKQMVSRALQEAIREQPKLAEVLRKHYQERPVPSRDLLKCWLRIDQPKILLDKESQLLQGTWQAIAWEEDGDRFNAKSRAEVLKYVRWTFDEDELRATKAFTITHGDPMEEKNVEVRGPGGTVVATYEVDASTTPKVLTDTTLSPFEGIVSRSIYKLEGDLLTVCMFKGEDREGPPKHFSAKPGSNCILVTLKKVARK